ncbi:MAG: UDP-N-acetylmuramoyl-tripeptide--D-alanyl-D-alanine ligase [Oscillospiraceae bacterium]|nr:UDP-N-acetylmuramoyl-tripeptide--D-alanyl-D-alanine ligase [Oscillospiraceae bacterium]
MDLSIEEIAKAVKGEISGDFGAPRIKNIVTDSRKVLPDSLFFALKGENADGHDFVAKAVENGALGAVVQKDKMKGYGLLDKRAAIIEVRDTGDALLDAAKYYKSLFKNIDVTVAVTGSVGKTTAKEFAYSVLGTKFKTQKSEGNFNTGTGLPFTLFSLDEDTKALVLEMGMDKPGEIKRLSETAKPETAVITNIGTAHIEKLGSKKKIKEAKFEILEGMEPGANIVLNADDPLLYSEKNKTGKKEHFFGINNREADFTAENIECDYKKSTSAFSADNFRFTIPAVGFHNIYDALPALAAGKIYGLTDKQIQQGFDNFKNAGMRQNMYDYNGITIIDDCYNASLESVLAAFEVLSKTALETKGRGIAVLADILEAGEHSNQIHADIGMAAVKKDISLYLFGEKSKAAFEAAFGGGSCDCFYFGGDKAALARTLFGKARKGDVILFKASRQMAAETVLEDFKNLF